MNSLPTRYTPSPPATVTMHAATGRPCEGSRPGIGSLLLRMFALVAPPPLGLATPYRPLVGLSMLLGLIAAGPALATSCNQATVSSGLEALYLFENNANDSSGNARNLTTTGTVTYSSTDKVEGSYAASLATTTSYLSTTNAYFGAAFTQKTVSMFIKPSSLNSDQALYEEGGYQNGISLFLLSTGNIKLSVADNSNNRTVEYPYPTDGGWHQVGFVYNGTSGVNLAWIYLDGHPVASMQGYGQVDSHGASMSLFNQVGTAAWQTANTDRTGDFPYTGLMDDVAVYSTALTPKNMLDVADCAGAALAIDFNLLDRQLAPMACETDAYLVQGTNTMWYSIDLVTGTDDNGLADNYATSLNATGYNVKDGRIWGTAHVGKLFTAVKKDATTWTVQLTGAIAGLPTATDLFAGDVNLDGKLYTQLMPDFRFYHRPVMAKFSVSNERRPC